MKRALQLLAGLPLIAAGCAGGCGPDPVSPEEAAQAVYGVSSLTRDALLLLTLQEGPAELAPGAEDSPDGTESATAGAANAARAAAHTVTFGMELLPQVGQSWYDGEGTLFVVREVNYDPVSGEATIVLDIFYPESDLRAQGEAVITVHTEFTPTDDSDDRLLYVGIEVGYKDGSSESAEYIELDPCDPQVDCDVDAGLTRVRANRTFTTDPHLTSWYYEVDVDLGVPDDDTDDTFERQIFQATRTDGLFFERQYVPGVPVLEGERPATGAITDTVVWPDDFDPRSVVRDVDWTSTDEGTVLTTVTYADNSVDSYLATFFADGTADIAGTRRDGASVTGMIDRNLPHHELHVETTDGGRVDMELVFRPFSVEARRTVFTPEGELNATANISGNIDGSLGVHYVDSAGFVAEGSILGRPEGVVLRGGEVATPDDVNIGFDLTLTATGEGRVSFDGDAARGHLSMIPVGGAQGQVQGKQIGIDAIGRIQ